MRFNQLRTTIIFSIITFYFQINSTAQIPYIQNSCYCVESNSRPNILYQYIVEQSNWIRNGGITYSGTMQIAETIEAIAINPVDNIIYAFDGDRFGFIEIGTTTFTLVNSGLCGTGKIKGNVITNFIFSDIDGLTYNPYTRELWCINRLSGSIVNDLLFKINPETGEVIKGIFGGFDFVEIEQSYNGPLQGTFYDVEDIAINPFTNQLNAVQNQNGPGIITKINKFDGTIEQEIYDLNEDNVKGLGFTGYSNLIGTTGDNGAIPNSTILVEFINFYAVNLGPIDPSLSNSDFEGFDCLSDYVDLALVANIIPGINGQTTFGEGDIVEIELEIYNQGTIEINDLQIAMHLPADVTVLSTNWQNLTGGKLYTTEINDIILNPNDTLSTIVELGLDNLNQSSKHISFEIAALRNDIISINNGMLIDLPDIDSKPDLLNQEVNIKDNIISEDGLFGDNEDEDDHDIATFNYIFNCPDDLVLLFVDKTIYKAKNSIRATSKVQSYPKVEIYAGELIFFDIGFEITPGYTLTADIKPCQ